MNKLSLYRLISIIHAVKCNKSESEFDANASFDKLVEFKNSLAKTSENEFLIIQRQIMNWAVELPIVTEQDVNELSKQN